MSDTAAREESQLDAPCLAPLDVNEFTALVEGFVRDGVVPAAVVAQLAPKYTGALNVLRTLAHHSHLLGARVRVLVLLHMGQLDARAREIVILRVAWLTRCHYEWAHHHSSGLECGLSLAELAEAGRPGYPAHWSEREAVLLRAVDEMHTDARTTDLTWQTLHAHYTRQQILEVFALVSEYMGLAFVLNSAAVSIDETLPDPAPLPPAADAGV